MVSNDTAAKPIDVMIRVLGMTGFVLGLLLTISAVVTGEPGLSWL